ncbi:hypothetical protein [Paenibacillus sp. MMO-58]|uniref:hypothetical protein n=1 Tax=Paenibacillus sp. MMO-58 TaxID=3081290 RepID=UPI003016BE39
MYKSVVRDGEFLVLVADGIFEETLFELPTEELADTIAFELQSAWDQGVPWGSYVKHRELKSSEIDNQIRDTLQTLKKMNQSEHEVELHRIKRRQDRVKKIEDARRWKSVLNWKNNKE